MPRNNSIKRRRVKRKNPYKPRDYDSSLGLAEPSGLRGYFNEMPCSVGTQIFSILPSVFGAAALFLLSFKIAKATKMSVTEVVIASLIPVVGAFSGMFMVKTHH